MPLTSFTPGRHSFLMIPSLRGLNCHVTFFQALCSHSYKLKSRLHLLLWLSFLVVVLQQQSTMNGKIIGIFMTDTLRHPLVSALSTCGVSTIHLNTWLRAQTKKTLPFLDTFSGTVHQTYTQSHTLPCLTWWQEVTQNQALVSIIFSLESRPSWNCSHPMLPQCLSHLNTQRSLFKYWRYVRILFSTFLYYPFLPNHSFPREERTICLKILIQIWNPTVCQRCYPPIRPFLGFVGTSTSSLGAFTTFLLSMIGTSSVHYFSFHIISYKLLLLIIFSISLLVPSQHNLSMKFLCTFHNPD